MIDEDRDGPHAVDVEGEHPADHGSAIGPPDADDQADRQAAQHGSAAHQQRYAEPVQQEWPVLQDGREIQGHGAAELRMLRREKKE